MKKILALALALIMVLGLATTASAEPTEQITVATTDNHSYAVYQILKGTLAEVEKDGKTVVVMTDVAEGANYKAGEDLTAALAALEAKKDAADAEALEEILKYVDMTTTAIGTVDNKTPLMVEPGYYLLKDMGRTQGSDPDGISKSLYLVEVIDDVQLSPKRGVIVPEKKVDDKNDSDTTPNYNLKNEDSADYDIGDDVPFTLKATLPQNYDAYSAYKLVFHDEAQAGLTFLEDSVKVYLNEAVEANLIAADKYALNTETDDDCTFELTFADLKVAVPAAEAGDSIIVKFNATLNSDAQLGFAGNANEMYLEFSNDPNWVADPDEETPPPPPTDVTPKDKVVVFTYQVLVNKQDEDGEPLVGATFKLYKQLTEAPAEDSGITYETVVNGEVTEYWQDLGAVSGDQSTQFTWTGVDDGVYKLVEIEAPTGYNKIDDIKFEITAEHDKEAADPHLTVLDGGEVFKGDAQTGVLTANIQNKPGAVLPETGGMGTTLFYVIGGLLVAAAVVLLVTKKRMASAE